MSQSFERLGNYILLEKLNAGGMAEVYLSKTIGANGVNKFLAIKRILPQFADNREFISMFKEEAKIAVNLDHNNVVSIIDFKAAQNQLYIVMEYVQGQNLRQILQQKKKKGLALSLDFIVYVIREVAAGLEHAHRCVDKATGKPLNIIHRDMSPQNIMISYDGEVKIVDFGIAKAEANGESTRVGTLKGKFSYMSPEQAEGLIIDQVSDIFSLGIILWELIADDRLFVANNEMNILKRIKECDIPDLRRVNPTVPAELERIVKKTLMKDKSLRYQSSADLQKDLTRFLNREFPDFTPNDFSTFMKFLFENEYSLTQERMVNYAKLDFGSIGEVNESTQLTNPPIRGTHPLPKAPMEADPQTEEENELQGLDREFATFSNVLEKPQGLQENQDPRYAPTQVAPRPQPRRTTLTDFPDRPSLKEHTGGRAPKRLSPQLANRSGVTSTGIRYKAPAQRPSQDFAGGLVSIITTLAMLGGLYFLAPRSIQNKIAGTVRSVLGMHSTQTAERPAPRTTPAKQAETSGEAEIASQVSFNVLIKSNPGRARIYVNDADTNLMTPNFVRVPARSPFTLTLIADGYLQYITRITPEREGQEILAELTPVEMGYLNINVVPDGIETKIYINNLELADRPPISRYPVPSNQEIKIRAIHKFSGLVAEKIVTVGNNEKKTVDLLLAKPARKKKERRR